MGAVSPRAMVTPIRSQIVKLLSKLMPSKKMMQVR